MPTKAQVVLDAANLKKAMRHLAKADPDFARILKEVGHPELREMPTGFSGLMRSIVGQQVSVHAARSIWLRLEAAVPGMEPADFLASVRRHLDEQGVASGPALVPSSNPSRQGRPMLRALEVNGAKFVGFALRLRDLTAEGSLSVQEQGLGVQRGMGCGVFVPAVRRP